MKERRKEMRACNSVRIYELLVPDGCDIRRSRKSVEEVKFSESSEVLKQPVQGSS